MFGKEIDISWVLEQIGDVNPEPFFNGSSEEPFSFACEVALVKAEVAAVANRTSIDAIQRWHDAESSLIRRRILGLKDDFGFGINRSQFPTLPTIGFNDFRYGKTVIRGGLSILEWPNSRTTYRPQMIVDFDNAFAEIPELAQGAIKDFADWCQGNDKYSGETGLKLEQALAAELIRPDQFNRIITARDAGHKIITNSHPIETNIRIPYFNEEEGEFCELVGYKEMWAITPLAD